MEQEVHMGMRIEKSAVDFAAMRPGSSARTQPIQGAAAGKASGLAPRRDTADEIRVGFGENTMSPSAAALRTISVNMERARRIVPSVEQLREEFRARRDELESAQRQDAEARASAAPAVEKNTRPEAAPRAVNAFQQEAETQASRDFPPPAQNRIPAPAPVSENAVTPARLDVLI